MPIVSVVIPTRSRPAWLKEAVESVLAQTMTDLEIIIVLNNATVEAAEMARKLGANDRVKVVELPAVTVPAARNFGMAQARGEWIAFLDDDDVWLPQKLQHAAMALSRAGAGPVLYCARQILVDKDLRGSTLSVMHAQPPVFPASLKQNIANGNTLVMNRLATELVNELAQPEGTVHDWWSYIVVSAAGGKIVFDPMPQVLYRLHKDNLIGRARPMPARAAAAMRRGPRIFMTMMHRHADALTAGAARLSLQAQADLKLIQGGLHGDFLQRCTVLRKTKLRRRTLLENLLFTYWFLTG